MKKLELALLGPPDFKLGNETINDLVLRKGLALIAYLAVTKQTHSREALAGLYWGEMPEEKARRNLRVALTKLRPFFDDFLIIQRRTVAFDVDSDYWLDVEVFEENLNQPNPSAAQLQTAVELYRGPFLADLPLKDAPLFEDWIRPYQERLRQMAMDALYRLSVANLEQHQYSQGIDNLSKLLILEPWMEEAHRQLMLLFALSGQRTAALAQFETCQAVLDEELGVEPGEATNELYQKILNEEIEPDDNLIIPSPSPAPPSVIVPFQALAAKPNFIGRDGLLNEICTALRTADTNTIQALVGMGGIGKSSLAVQVAHAMRSHFGDGVLWANAAISDPMTILSSWAQLYGYDFSQITDLESMAAAYRSVLADKHVLIVLDDVTSITRIRPLLPGSERCQVLLTTRDHDLARGLDAQVCLMKELSLANGRLLLASILGEERLNREPEAATDICNLLENLPLAVEIIAQRLKSRPRRRLADVAERLRHEDQRLSELQISDRAVRASFAISFQSLGAQLRRMFTLMGLFNGRSFTPEALAFIAELDRYEAEDRIFALTALSLAEEEGRTRYQQHALLADFALEKLGDEAVEEYGRFAQYYLQFAQQHQHDYDALRPEWDNMMDAMQAAHDHQLWQIVIDFADALHDAWFARARYSEARKAYVWVTNALELTDVHDKLINCYLNWGLACIEQTDFAEAEQYLRKGLQIAESTEKAHGFSELYLLLSRIAFERNEFDLAHKYLNKCEQIRQNTNDYSGLSAIYYRRARILVRQGEYKEAIALCEQTLELQEKADDLYGNLKTNYLLTHIYIEIKEYKFAKHHCHIAIELAERLGRKEDYAMSLDKMATIHHRLGELELASDIVQQSLKVFEQIGSLKFQGLALYTLSVLKEDFNQYEEALNIGLKSFAFLEQINDQFNSAIVSIHIGDVYYHLNNLEQSRFFWEKAKTTLNLIGNHKVVDRIQAKLDSLPE